MDNITKNITGVSEVLDKVPSEEAYYDVRQYNIDQSGEYVKKEFPKKEPISSKSTAKTNGNDSEMIAHRNYLKKFHFTNADRMQLIKENESLYRDKPKLVEKYKSLMKDFEDAEELRIFNECTDIRMTNNLDKLENIRKMIIENLKEFVSKSQGKDVDIELISKELREGQQCLESYSKVTNLDINYPIIYLKLTDDSHVIFCKLKSEGISNPKDYNKYSEEFTKMFLFDSVDNHVQEIPYLKFTQTTVGCTNLIRKLNKLYSCMNKIEMIKLDNANRCNRLKSIVENALNR